MKSKDIRLMFVIFGILLILVTFTYITPILEQVSPYCATQFYLAGKPAEIVKAVLNIEIPKTTEIIEFEQNDTAWYNFSLKCEMFSGARTQLRENISESYVIGKNRPEIYDLKIDSVNDIPGFYNNNDWFNVTDDNIRCYYWSNKINDNIDLVYKHMPIVSAYITRENGKEYIYINII